MSTIYALATPPGRAGLAVIRISGPEADTAVERLAGPLPRPRRAGLRRLRREDGAVLDEAIILRFPEGESYTGEAVVELQCHGSPAVVSAVLHALSRQPGLRPAEPGEFTRRALLHGRMDLAQVEGLADLISAETEAQREHAWRLFRRGASDLVEGWRSRLRQVLVSVEAAIDFSDQDIEPAAWDELRAVVASVRGEIESELAGLRPAERLRDGMEVAIIGPPNSGKSTLLNYLAGREAALTSDVPGTTRDVIEVHMDVRGLPVTFLDTAGMRGARDEVERKGIDRARARAESADMCLILIDKEGDKPVRAPEGGDLVRVGKADLHACSGGISGLTGAGVDETLGAVHDELVGRTSRASLFNRHRHRVSLEGTVSSLRQLEVEQDLPVEVSADLLWAALTDLGRVVGQVDIEEVLGDVFLNFCIGK